MLLQCPLLVDNKITTFPPFYPPPQLIQPHNWELQIQTAVWMHREQSDIMFVESEAKKKSTYYVCKCCNGITEEGNEKQMRESLGVC